MYKFVYLYMYALELDGVFKSLLFIVNFRFRRENAEMGLKKV